MNKGIDKITKQCKRTGVSLLCAWIITALFLLIGCNSTSSKTGPDSRPLVLINGFMIDGTGRDAVQNAVVVIRGDRIAAAGTSGSVEIPSDANIFDLKGAAILPGFINTHTHYVYDPRTLKAFARAGVTTVRDLQDSDPARMKKRSWFTRRDELAKDGFNSRLLAAGPMVTVPGGYPVYMGLRSEKALLLDSPEEARQETQKLIDAGADTIKIAIERGKVYLVEKPLPTLSIAEVKAIVSAAHKNNIKVAAHITHSEDIPLFLEAGCDEIVHMVLDDQLSDDLIKQLVEADVYWGPTLELWSYVEKAPFVLAADPNFQSYLPAIANLKKFVKAGGKVVLGTDFGGLPGGVKFQNGMPMIEIEAMLKAEMTPMQVILAATKNAAYIVNRENELGTLETGKIADILVVRGNPLDDINALANPLLVVHNGIVIRSEL